MTQLPLGFNHEVRRHLTSPDVPIDPVTRVPVIDLDNYCCGAHGLSVLITTTASDEKTYKVLFDTGPEAQSIRRNIASLKLAQEMSELDTIVLSHWHRDHSGGILEVLKSHSPSKDAITVDLHPSRPIARGIAPPPLLKRVVGRLPEDPTFEEINEAGGKVITSNSGHCIAGDTVYVSGEIPRKCEWEAEGLIGGARWVKSGERENVPAVGDIADDGSRWVLEPDIMDERYIAIDVEGKGLILFSACSHAGICNVVQAAVETFHRPIYMIVGGFHLAGPELQKRIQPTVEFIKDHLAQDGHVLPLHCTGFHAKTALERGLQPGAVVPAGVGIGVEVE
ncbi:hypothetical protein FRC03_006812 [Tulasnella sp. 419]|nr:hypothetical protein FRC03_006812 [Tulasnella sp. 419]